MRNDCPDCASKLCKIQVLGQTYSAATHKGLAYGPEGAKRGFFGGWIKPAGTVEAMMCESCSRVVFYGVPND